MIEAEGWAPVVSGDPVGTKQRALVDAQKKAVEKVLGVYISAKTRVDQSVAVSEKILAKVEGYVGRYDVLGEREEGGTYKMVIRALVLYRKLGDDLKVAGLLRPPPPPGNPRVAVFVRGPDGKDASGAPASAALRRALLERGFAVVDLDDSASMELGVVRSSSSALSAGLKLKADLVALGDVRLQPIQDARIAGFRSYRASLHVAVTRPGDGAVVADKVQEASAIDPAPEIAASKAQDTAGQLIGETLAAELSAGLKSRTTVTVRVAGLSGLEELESFIEDLRGTPEIDAVALSGYDEGMGELAVTTEGVAGEELTAEVLRLKQYGLHPTSISSYEIELQKIADSFPIKQ